MTYSLLHSNFGWKGCVSKFTISKAKEIPKNKAPKGSRKAEAIHPERQPKQSNQNDWFSPNTIGYSTPVQYSEGLGHVKQGLLQFNEQAVRESLNRTAHHQTDIVSHLALIPIRYPHIADELET